MSRRAVNTPAGLRTACLLAAFAPLSGCYLLQAAQGQMALNARREPIAQLLAAPATPRALRAQLELSARLRDFASRELKLPDNDSYRSYADIGRPYVVWNVFAAAEFSVEPRRWCFPIAGCVAYRGYFSERRAQAFALGLEARGFDAYVAGVPAYSTLGHFADPVLSTMLGWDEAALAALLFHELAHQLVYVRDESAFNEAFATVVADEGVRRWLAAGGREPALAAFRAQAARSAEIAALVSAGRNRLRQIYAAPLAPAEKRARKALEFARLRAAYAALRARWGSGGYEWLFGSQLNNALLLSVATYHDCEPALAAELAAAGGLPEFYAAMRELARPQARARRAALCAPAAPEQGPMIPSG